jgi:hypothetical protein
MAGFAFEGTSVAASPLFLHHRNRHATRYLL